MHLRSDRKWKINQSVWFTIQHIKLLKLLATCRAKAVPSFLRYFKVARYSFSGSINPKFEQKLCHHKQRFGKIATTVALNKDENLLWSGLQRHRSWPSNEMTLLPIFCHCNPDHTKSSSLSDTTVVAIFPNFCLWWRSLCSNLGGIDPEKLYRATFWAWVMVRPRESKPPPAQQSSALPTELVPLRLK